MKFWHYIGEFLLFRWLFGTHESDNTQHDVPSSANRLYGEDIIDDCMLHHYDNRPEDDYYDGDYESYNNFLDDEDDYDLLDDFF